MPRIINVRFTDHCIVCEGEIPAGSDALYDRDEGLWHVGCGPTKRNLDDPEYARGYHETRLAQQAGPAGSAAREQAYLDMEAQWAREGFDG